MTQLITFFFILLAFLALILLGVKIFPSNIKLKSTVVLNSSSKVIIFIIFLVWSSYLYNSISPAVYKDIIITTTYVINRITIELQSNNLDYYQLECIHRELLLHINCNQLYLNYLLSLNPYLNTHSSEWISALASEELTIQNLADLSALLDIVKTHLFIQIK